MSFTDLSPSLMIYHHGVLKKKKRCKHGMVELRASPLPGSVPRRGRTSCKGCVGLGRLEAKYLDVHDVRLTQ